jgi:hypothetical protein
MNAAGATTITVNTALFAAGDSVQIQNIGAGVCTVTAGTATVNTAGSLALSQWEGGQLYFTSASASIFFDVVQSATATSGLTKIISTAFTAVANTGTSFDGVFTSTYTKYIVTLQDILGSVAGELSLQLRVGAVTQNQATHYGGRLTIPNTGSSATLQTSAATVWQPLYLSTTGPSASTINFFNVGYTTNGPQITYLSQQRDSANGPQMGGGAYQQNINASGFILTPASGTVTGRATVYGLET